MILKDQPIHTNSRKYHCTNVQRLSIKIWFRLAKRGAIQYLPFTECADQITPSVPLLDLLLHRRCHSQLLHASPAGTCGPLEVSLSKPTRHTQTQMHMAWRHSSEADGYDQAHQHQLKSAEHGRPEGIVFGRSSTEGSC